jgi:hypothetical protein
VAETGKNDSPLEVVARPPQPGILGAATRVQPREFRPEELEVLRYRCANRRYSGASLDGPCPFAPCACWPKDGPWQEPAAAPGPELPDV